MNFKMGSAADIDQNHGTEKSDSEDDDSALIVWEDSSSKVSDLRHLLRPNKRAATGRGDRHEVGEEISPRIPLPMGQEIEHLSFDHGDSSAHEYDKVDESKERKRKAHPDSEAEDTPATISKLKRRRPKQHDTKQEICDAKEETKQSSKSLMEPGAANDARFIAQTTLIEDQNHFDGQAKQAKTSNFNKAMISRNAQSLARHVLSQTQTVDNITYAILCCDTFRYKASPIGQRNLFCSNKELEGQHQQQKQQEQQEEEQQEQKQQRQQQQQQQQQLSIAKAHLFGGVASGTFTGGVAGEKGINMDIETPTICYENNINEDRSSGHEFSGWSSERTKGICDISGDTCTNNSNIANMSSGFETSTSVPGSTGGKGISTVSVSRKRCDGLENRADMHNINAGRTYKDELGGSGYETMTGSLTAYGSMGLLSNNIVVWGERTSITKDGSDPNFGYVASEKPLPITSNRGTIAGSVSLFPNDGGGDGMRRIGSLSSTKSQGRVKHVKSGRDRNESLLDPPFMQTPPLHQGPEPGLSQPAHELGLPNKEGKMKDNKKQIYDEFEDNDEDWDLEAIDRSIAAMTQSSRYIGRLVKVSALSPVAPTSTAITTSRSEFSDAEDDIFDNIDFKAVDRLICQHQKCKNNDGERR